MDTEQAIRDAAFLTDTIEGREGSIVALACKDHNGRVYGAVIDGPSLTVTPFLTGEDAGREFVRRVRQAALAA